MELFVRDECLEHAADHLLDLRQDLLFDDSIKAAHLCGENRDNDFFDLLCKDSLSVVEIQGFLHSLLNSLVDLQLLLILSVDLLRKLVHLLSKLLVLLGQF